MAEARVARYVRERGYTFEVEPEFGTGRHPDYLITAGGHTLVAEVKAFETYGMFDNAVPGQVVSRLLTEALAPDLASRSRRPSASSKDSGTEAGRWSRARQPRRPADPLRLPVHDPVRHVWRPHS